jgi:site-specific recombinase XerD
VPDISKECFFWSGESKKASATGDWHRAPKGVFKEAGIPDAHAHRFRDAFPVGLLQAAVPMERVSVLLGRSSIKVTEKQYSPWVRVRLQPLEAEVGGSWERPLDRVVLEKVPDTVSPTHQFHP